MRIYLLDTALGRVAEPPCIHFRMKMPPADNLTILIVHRGCPAGNANPRKLFELCLAIFPNVPHLGYIRQDDVV